MQHNGEILPSVALAWAGVNAVVGIIFGFIARFFYRRSGVYVIGDEYRFALFSSAGSMAQAIVAAARSHFVFAEMPLGGYWVALWPIFFWSSSIFGFRLSLHILPIVAIPDEKRKPE